LPSNFSTSFHIPDIVLISCILALPTFSQNQLNPTSALIPLVRI
jgi:hypothetical protein